MFHSGWSQSDPWLQIDLGARRLVTQVDVYHRMTMGRDLFGYHEIWVSDDPSAPTTMCYNATGGASSLTWNLPCGKEGRYVRIALPGAERTLMAMEVSVYKNS